jgi:glycosyltransferase involved in cell wall biosynthesis
MNIAEITTYEEGGVYTHVMELVKRLKANTIIISGNTKKSGYKKENGQTFFHIPCIFSIWEIYFINPLGSYKKVKEVLNNRQIELVHLHGPLFTFGGGIMRKSKIPSIMTTHYVLDFKGNRFTAALYKGIIQWVTKSTAKHVDKIVCVNEEYIPIYTSWGIEQEKLVVIPNGIDTKKFSPGKSDIKKKLNCSHLLVFWGRLGYQKNIQFLIKAFKTIKTPGTKLAIIGKGPDMKKLKALSGGNENIIFTGYLPDNELLDYARGADIAVLPSRAESWGLVIGEAMACELPVISSDVGKAQELLGKDRGIVLKKETAKELAEYIDYLLSNKKVMKEMGKKARKFIVEHYGWDGIVKKTEELYKTVIKQHNDKSNHLNK